MRLIDADKLKEDFNQEDWGTYNDSDVKRIIDNAPTVELQMGRMTNGVIIPIERPHGKREFIEILAQNVPEDLCTYPEYKGKPYYSIHFKENGEDFVGFGTYNPEVLSRFLRDYFMRGGEDNEQ